ncbi:RNA polymerase, sigma-24 subunit, ECF subfamily [Ruminiclostridium papyrosolvens DSM 2782]|uniref:RNA polymerase, sigma-24 subunit, ECF subfamily n=1 Tax=Ruminiclostridium papyrosolvens DSM 2782 TaxID=588581 RepID=F1TE61_9FIRM|nr:RNA polymerase sigma factor [Ruminiclostridium papyrosolvens]EGD47301.1 RNA polymerase, sigma-24 subunit, ECF subfamily [Ruminiclostridium papyrosolvens DSM 2782]WES34647.1 RNA polymerase sigma factor [Ruminiclostridium papyrosolvens DSM 2782]
MLEFFLSVLETEDERNKFTTLYTYYESTMYNVAFSILRDRYLAEDAVHDALLKIINYIPDISDIKCHKTRALIVIIIKSTAIDIYRKRDKQYTNEKTELPEEADTSELPLDHIIADESFNELKIKLNKLSKEYLDIIMLKHLYELSNNEISDVLCISGDAVRQRLSRAKKAIRKIIEEENK